MDTGIIIVLGLALLFFAGIGYTAWKEYRERRLQTTNPPKWVRDNSTIEESNDRKY